VLDAHSGAGVFAEPGRARIWRAGRSSLLGLIISDIRNPFFPEVTAAFQEQALLNNMDALVLNTNYDAQRDVEFGEEANGAASAGRSGADVAD